MEIRKEKDNLILSFEYNAAIIEIIKQFESRKYEPKTKEWSIPIIHTKKVLDRLVPLGFRVRADVLDNYNKSVRRSKMIDRILEDRLKKTEREVIKKTGLPLFNYQQLGTAFLYATESSLLGDEPGTGKTIQTLATVVLRKANKVLLICPSSLKRSLREEIEKWLKIDDTTLIEGTKVKRQKLWKQDTRFYIMNYELLLRDLDEINDINWDFVITDEATRISNPKAKQSKAIKKINAKYRLALTGTPLNNAIQDVWNILDFCHPNILGSYWQFTEKYCLKDRFNNIIGYKNLGSLKQILKDYMIRRLKSDVLKELPEKLYENIYIEFSDTEKKVYNAVKKNIREELREYEIQKVLNDKFLTNILVQMVRLRQATGSMQLISKRQESSKLNVLEELLNDILHGDSKTIIYTQFVEMAHILKARLQKYNPLMIIGEVDEETRFENVRKFTNENQYKVMIMSDSGTYGLNLQRASYLIHYDLPWSISKIEQREGRAHRIGQKSNLTIYKLIVQDTIDEYILKILHKKSKLSKDILGDKTQVRKVKVTKKDIKRILA